MFMLTQTQSLQHSNNGRAFVEIFWYGGCSSSFHLSVLCCLSVLLFCFLLVFTTQLLLLVEQELLTLPEHFRFLMGFVLFDLKFLRITDFDYMLPSTSTSSCVMGSMLPVYPEWPLFIVHSVFSNVYLIILT